MVASAAEPAALPPTAEAQLNLRRAFTAAQAGLSSQAENLLTQSINDWESTKQPVEEIASLYKTRGGIRIEQGRLAGALEDLSQALRLMPISGEGADPSQRQRVYQLRARVHGALGNRRAQVDDLSSAIALLDKLDAIEATNPYVFSDRAQARSAIGEYAGAAEDAETAEMLFKETGDKIRRVIAAADGAIASYGAGEVQGAVDKMRYVFKTKRTLATNNPDDIALLQELSRKDAELHLAYAAHLYGREQRVVDASRQWESGCVRLETYVVDGKDRYQEERRLRELEAERAESAGKELRLRAESVKTPFVEIDDFRARLNGLDPKNPYVTQRAGQSYFWYKTSEGEVERRDAGNPLRDREEDIAIGLSCEAFTDPGWVARYRPEWPKSLSNQLKTFAAEVEQRKIPLPPKGSPPTRGEIEF
jgi:tetratricopeptide (TPR) repeat protein